MNIVGGTGLVLPAFFGAPGLPVHAELRGPNARHAYREAFEEAYQSLKKRIEAFLALPLETMTPQEAVLAARQIHTGE